MSKQITIIKTIVLTQEKIGKTAKNRMYLYIRIFYMRQQCKKKAFCSVMELELINNV